MKRRIGLTVLALVVILGAGAVWLGFRQSREGECLRLAIHFRLALDDAWVGMRVESGQEADKEEALMKDALDEFSEAGCANLIDPTCDFDPQYYDKCPKARFRLPTF